MKNKYYCKKCGIVVELDEYDEQFRILTKVFCSRCKGKVMMWKVVKNITKREEKQNGNSRK